MATERGEFGQTLCLPDGRRLGYAEYGARGGVPVFAFHGTPGTRLMSAIADRPAKELGIRLIAPDRPGFGLSDFAPGRRLADWPDDVAALADALAVQRFAVAGVSGGGPYAAACGWKLAARIEQVLIVSGLGPVRGAQSTPDLGWQLRLLFDSAASAPWLARALSAAARAGWKHAPGRLYEEFVSLAPPRDQAILRQPEVRACLIAGFQDAFKEDGRGVAHELVLFGRPWGFPLREIRAPVHLWHGEADALVPVGMGRHLAALVPDCRATFVPDAGHYWVFDNARTLLSSLRTTPAQAAR